jgi:hypothetical protein
VSLTLPEVIRQTVFVRTALATGVSAVPPSPPTPTTPTATPATDPNATAPTTAASAANNTSTAAPNPNTPLTQVAITPDHRGVVMQWWLRNANLPITRSCLMGGGL